MTLLDPQGEAVPQGEIGEVCIRSAAVMRGYWKRPEETAETLRGGWLHTGDLAYRDEEGFYYLVDRAKDMIVTGLGATNVYSRAVEDALVTHPSIRAAAVVGVPHPTMGEAVHAYVIPAGDADISVEELRAHTAGELNELWAPQDIDVIDAFPLTEYGKVDKKALRARWSEQRAVPSGGQA